MSVKEGADCEITLHNVQIESNQAAPVLTLTKGTHVRLNCDGDSCFRGSSGSGSSIRLASGAIEVTGSGTEVLGIGSYEGGVPVSITDCAVLVSIQAVAAVGVGSMRGDTPVEMQNLAITLKCAGAAICGAGVLHGGKAEVRGTNIAMNTEMNGRNIVCIGTNGGTADCEIRNTELHLNCEGGSVTGVGNPNGGGKVYLRATSLTGAFRTGSWLYTGCSGSTARLEYVINDIKMNP